MNFYEKIDNIYNHIISIEQRKSKKKKIKVYSEGVKAKLKNAEYALNIIKKLDSQTDDDKDITDANAFPIEDKIQFYVDSFFAFLYSTFDVVSHVVNQKYEFCDDEKKVSFKTILKELESSNPNNLLYILLKKICHKHYFINLDKYRNCSTHRRQIYIETRMAVGTKAYEDYTSELCIPKRVLVDDPFSLYPKTTKDKFLVEYSEDLFEKTKKDIILIFKKIKEIY